MITNTVTIRRADVAANLLQRGYHVVAIKPDPDDYNRTNFIFYFKCISLIFIFINENNILEATSEILKGYGLLADIPGIKRKYTNTSTRRGYNTHNHGYKNDSDATPSDSTTEGTKA